MLQNHFLPYSYRFRFIHAAATACPTLVFVNGTKLRAISSDGMPFKQTPVDVLSVISGERYDFLLRFDDLSTPVPLFVVYLSNFSIFEVAWIQKKEKPLKPPFADPETLKDQLCKFFLDKKESEELAILNPANPVMRVKGKRGVNGTIQDQIWKWCGVNMTNLKGIELRELQAVDSSDFEATSGYHQLMARTFEDTTEAPLSPLPVELSSRGKDELGLFRFQMNNISFRSPPVPALYFKQPENTFCNADTIKNGITKEADVNFYWCPHSVDLEPNPTVEVLLISKNSSFLQHPLHMHGHSFAVVAQG